MEILHQDLNTFPNSARVKLDRRSSERKYHEEELLKNIEHVFSSASFMFFEIKFCQIRQKYYPEHTIQTTVYSYLLTLVHRSWISSTLKMEDIRSSETSVNKMSTRCHIPQDGILHSHRRENLKSQFIICFLTF
jgi:hypothetical protein